MSGATPNSLSDVDDVIMTSDVIAKLPEWMETVGKSMAARADAVVKRPQLVGELNAEKIRELYRKMTAKDMQTWVLYRDGRESEVGKTKPDKKKEFKKMYPLLTVWMNKHGHSLKSENVTPKALGMLALANAVQVHNEYLHLHIFHIHDDTMIHIRHICLQERNRGARKKPCQDWAHKDRSLVAPIILPF